MFEIIGFWWIILKKVVKLFILYNFCVKVEVKLNWKLLICIFVI